MNTALRFAFCLVVASCAFGLARAHDKPLLPKSPPLTCTIHSQPTCELGQVPAISVEIANWTEGEIYLIGSLDASDLKWRYPFCYFEVIGPDGKPVKTGVARCGNMNTIREKDFVKVPRGGKFNPYQTIDDHGFFPPCQMVPATFQAEGEYRIRYVYSTENADPKCWLGDVRGSVAEMLNAGGTHENVVKLLAQVPKTTVTSNEITIKVVRPKQ